MIEKNRVMRFDTLDPNDRFVAHIKFPHPVCGATDVFVSEDSTRRGVIGKWVFVCILRYRLSPILLIYFRRQSVG